MIVEKHYIKTSSEIVRTQLGIPKGYKQKCIDEIYNIGDSQNQTTNVKALMSSWWVWQESEVFNLLLTKIQSKVEKIIPLKDDRFQYKLIDAWCSIYKKGHYTIPHHHKPSEIAFVYYFKSSGNTPLLFEDFDISPMDDDLILFPSHLLHSVPEHTDKQDRICIAGNFKRHHVNWEKLKDGTPTR